MQRLLPTFLEGLVVHLFLLTSFARFAIVEFIPLHYQNYHTIYQLLRVVNLPSLKKEGFCMLNLVFLPTLTSHLPAVRCSHDDRHEASDRLELRNRSRSLQRCSCVQNPVLNPYKLLNYHSWNSLTRP